MDIDRLFSKDTAAFLPSPTREIFRLVDLSKIYSFAGGFPSPDTFPLEDFSAAMKKVIGTVGAEAFQYGGTQGVPALRRALADRYGESLERTQITSSSQQGIDMSARVLLDPGDVVLTSNPTYLGALQSFASYRALAVPVAYDPDPALYAQAYETAFARAEAEGRRVKFIYTIPDFQNPSGETLSLEHRKVIAAAARSHEVLIVEDAPYSELRYEGAPVTPMRVLEPELTIHLGSFSKVMAPGFRLGWIFADPKVLYKIYVCKQALDLCPPVFDQHVAAEFITGGALDRNLVRSKDLYRRRRDLMLSLLEQHMPKGVSWTRPEGGLFLFLRLPEGFDSETLLQKRALPAKVAFVAGNFFHPGWKDGKNTMRLSFSYASEEALRAGIPILAGLIRDEIARLNETMIF